MQTISTIGLDIANKSVFQVHGVDAVGQVVVRRHQSAVDVTRVRITDRGRAALEA